jgi:hypothetical protein
LLLRLCQNTYQIQASNVLLDVYYPESLLDHIVITSLEGNIFNIGYSSSPYTQELVASSSPLYYGPWFGNFSYFINNYTDRVDNNHWRKNIDLNDFEGELYLELSANYFGPTVTSCLEDGLYAIGICLPRHSPYLVSIASATDTVSLSMFPSFSAKGIGKTSTLISNYYSSALGNVRDISIYIPWSLIENPLPREVNSLVLLDGSLDYLSFLTDQGGLDVTLLNGGLPEMIIIGIPPALNGTACPSGASGCDQRSYELTPTPCDSSVSQCSTQQVYGGAAIFLDFVWESVIPAVYLELNLQVREVAITGFR